MKLRLTAAAALGVLALAGCAAPVTHGTKGPFNASCQIAQKGIATIHVTGNGARTQHLRSFDLLLTRQNGHALRSRHIVLSPRLKVPPSGLLIHADVVREAVSYRAYSCAITKLRP